MADAPRRDITIIIGDTFSDYDSLVRWNDDGSPMNITGYTYTMEIRPAPDSATLLESVTFAVTSGAAGTFGGTLTSSETSVLPVLRSAAYSLREDTTGGTSTTLLEGAVEIKKVAT